MSKDKHSIAPVAKRPATIAAAKSGNGKNGK